MRLGAYPCVVAKDSFACAAYISSEISERHPWFLGCQFHPEFKSRPTKPHPLFSHFIRAAGDKFA